MNLIVALITVAAGLAGVLTPLVHRLRELLAALDECFLELIRDLEPPGSPDAPARDRTEDL